MANAELERPDEVAESAWVAMDERQKALAVSEDMRPQGISTRRWNGWSGRERATQAMLLKTREWDFRGSLSDMPPAGVEIEDLAIMARIMARLSRREVETLVRIGYLAAGPDG